MVGWRRLRGDSHPTAWHPPSRRTQNVAPEKLFSRERAVQQLLGIIDGASMAQAGRFFDWAGKEVEW